MGFSDYYVHSISTPTPKAKNAETSSSATTTTVTNNFTLEDSGNKETALIPDQEILDATEEIYFRENVDTGVYELNVSITWTIPIIGFNSIRLTVTIFFFLFSSRNSSATIT